MSRNRTETWLALIVVHSTPPPKWADAVEQGRQIVRLGLTDQNLPGLSVAVGVGGNIVWAEGFGWANLEKRVPVAPETEFRIGTASTAITSAAVGLLLEEGRLGRARPTIRAGPEPASFSTPSDLVRFGMAINSGKLLQPATVQLLQTSQRLSSGEETGYGLGWDIENVTLADKHTRWVGHDGTSFGGTLASLMTFPERGIVVAVTSNISYTDTPALALKIAQAFAEHASSK